MATTPETGPDSHACKVATEHADWLKDHIIKAIKDFKPQLPPPVREAALAPPPPPPGWDKDWKDWDKKEWSEEKILWILQFVVDHPKWFPEKVVHDADKAKDELHHAREVRWEACKAPEEHGDDTQHPTENADTTENPATADFSQVKDVPVGPVDTGGGPA